MLRLAKLFQINLRIVSFEEDDDTEISLVPFTCSKTYSSLFTINKIE